MKRLFLLMLVLTSLVFPQNSQHSLHNISKLNLNFGEAQSVTEFFADDTLLYVNTVTSYPQEYIVLILDISDPNNPLELARKYKNESRGDSQFADRVIYKDNSVFANPFYEIYSEDGNVLLHYFWCANKIAIVDPFYYQFKEYDNKINIIEKQSGNTFSLIETDTIGNIFSEITGIVVINYAIYVTTRFNNDSPGLFLFDVSIPASVIQLDSPFDRIDAIGMVSGDNELIIGDGFLEFKVLDVTNPYDPEIKQTKFFSNSVFYGTFYNDQCFLSSSNNISVYDNEYQLVKEIFTIGKPYQVFIINDLLISATNLGIEFYDISNINNPVRINSYGANIGKPHTLIGESNNLFIANGGDGINIIDISNPFQPNEISKLDLNGYMVELAINEDILYAADYYKGVVIIDISQINEPVVLSNLYLVGGVVSLSYLNGKVFALSDSNILYIIDVTNPIQPIIENTYAYNSFDKYWGYYKKVRASGDKIWLKLYSDYLYGYSYTSETGLTELFKFGDEYGEMLGDLDVQDSLLFMTNTRGIKILNTNSLTFLNEEYFGDWNIETEPLCTAYDIDNYILYLSLGVFGTSGISVYNLSYNISLEDYIGIGYFAPTDIIFLNNYLYCLVENELYVFSPIIIDVDENENKLLNYSYSLSNNYPNPFNPTTTIKYELPKASNVKIEIFNSLGELVKVLKDEYHNAGRYEAVWNGRDNSGMQVSSGVYFYRMHTEGFTLVKKMMLVK
ncbi:MAG: T9SS type A sorting domain-containing protein [Bacteroidota bacterium]